MRKLMWFTIGFAAACVGGIYWGRGMWLFLLALLCFVNCAALYFLKSNLARKALLVVLGCAIGFTWLGCYHWFYLNDAIAYDGKTVDVAIQVEDYSYETQYGIAADGIVELAGKTYKTKFYLNESKSLTPGDCIRGSFRFRYTADGGEKEPTYHQGKGIFLLAYARGDVDITSAEASSWRHFPVRMRRNIMQILDAVFPEDVVGFARALLLGDSSLLTYRQDIDFQVTGIRHVIAVSGLHVAILFSLVIAVFGERRWVLVLLGIPVLVLFAAVAGFTPSIVRACIMQVLMILALLVNKEYDPPTALSFAVLTMLAITPHTITSVSFQLSVGCMIGMFLFNTKIREYLLDERRFGPAKGSGFKARCTRWIVSSVSVTLSAMITTTPLCAYYFGSVSLIGIVTNLLTLWVISFVFYGIMLACLLGAIFAPAGMVVGWIVAMPIRYVLTMVKILGAFPLAAVYTTSNYILLWLVFSYVLLIVFIWLPKKHPLVFGICVNVLLVVALLGSWLEPRMDDYRFTVLDVGQGQCILLQSADRCYMVDCGGDSPETAADMAAQTLLSQGINRLDGVILTHYDEDHAGGALFLLERIPADTLYLPPTEDESGVQSALIKDYGDRIQWIKKNTQISFADTTITVFPSATLKSSNESSLCILFQPGNYDILITGDRSAAGERDLLEKVTLPKLEILVAGHHGAKNATSLELLYATHPAIAVVSVSEHNNYGHPSEDTVRRLLMMECKIYRTDLQGTIVFRG